MKICNCFNMPYSKLFMPYQVHGNDSVFVDDSNCGNILNNNKIICDASITNIANIPIGAKCADCMTIIIYEKKQKYISAIHSGWKGVINEVVCKTIKRMINQYSCNIKDLIICIGPCICKQCFEVMEDVKDIFEKKYSNSYIQKVDNQHYTIDLQKILEKELIKLGVDINNIHFSKICTKCNSKDFFSYRKSKITGIMANYIMLK